MTKTMTRNCWIYLAMVLAFLSSASVQAAAPQKAKDFYVLEIPNTGSQLVGLLSLMTERKPVVPAQDLGEDTFNKMEGTALEVTFNKWKKANLFPVSHFVVGSDPCKRYSTAHPETVKMIIVRDLRDALVSCVYRNLDKINGNTVTQKIWHLLNARGNPFDIYADAEEAAVWAQDKDVVVCRYEELIGLKGGGTLQDQEKAVVKLSNALGIHLKMKILHKMVLTLNNSGVKVLPPEERIGSWKAHFAQVEGEDKELGDLCQTFFERNWGALQKALGYLVK